MLHTRKSPARRRPAPIWRWRNPAWQRLQQLRQHLQIRTSHDGMATAPRSAGLVGHAKTWFELSRYAALRNQRWMAKAGAFSASRCARLPTSQNVLTNSGAKQRGERGFGLAAGKMEKNGQFHDSLENERKPCQNPPSRINRRATGRLARRGMR